MRVGNTKMPLCKVGKALFDDYSRILVEFSDLYSNTEIREEQEKIENRFMRVFMDYRSHIDHCLECNIDDREIIKRT